AACGTLPNDPLPSPAPAPTLPTALMGAEAVEPLFASPSYGVQAFLWWQPDIDQWAHGRPPQPMTAVQEMGFGWVKQEFAWRDIEGIEKGAQDWWRPDQIVLAAEMAGLNLVARLDRQPEWAQPPGTPLQDNRPPQNLADYGDFCFAIADRYRGRIRAYQVWNEPNLSREWGGQPPDPAAYTELLRVCYEGIKRGDPAAIVISAGLAPTGNDDAGAMSDIKFLQGMYAAGASAYFDVLGVHAPGYNAPPEVSPDEAAVTELYGNGRWFAFRHVEDMRAIMVANGDGRKQVAVLEMGWTLDEVNEEYAWFAVDEATQADYLVRAYQYAAEHWQPWISLMTTIYIADPNWTAAQEQWWWAIVLPDGTRRQAFFALQAMEKMTE
ncbi:MAG: hypothetical protein ACE5EY_16875, partial [Anaerolineae bacterium]